MRQEGNTAVKHHNGCGRGKKDMKTKERLKKNTRKVKISMGREYKDVKIKGTEEVKTIQKN